MSKASEILYKVNQAIMESSGLKIHQLSSESDLAKDLGIDFLTMLEIILRIEGLFNIQIENKHFARYFKTPKRKLTVGSLCAYVAILLLKTGVGKN